MIEIYGIPKEAYHCYGCISAMKLLDDLGIPYTLKPVFKQVGVDIIPDRDMIEELAGRLNSKSLRFVYPQIFIDNEHIGGYKELRAIYYY